MLQLTATALPTRRALLVDDDREVRDLVHLLIDLADIGVEVIAEASSAAEGLTCWRAAHPEVIVLDDHMPGGNGLALAATILAECPTQRVILFSASLDEETVALAADLGIYACVPKLRVNDLPDLIVASLAA
jgi:DNA-binding NarL/FixJ family response regulator